MPNSSRRALLRALAASLLFHVVLLFSGVKVFSVQRDSPAGAISAIIRPLRGHDPSPPPSAPTARSPSLPAKPPAPEPRRAAATQVAVARPTPFESSAAPATALPRDSVSPPAPGLSSGLGAGSRATAPPGPPPGAGGEGLSADDLRQYRLSLAIAARGFKRYPALASQRGWEGTAEVALNVSASGPAPEVVLVRSSGRGVLDQQALEMLTQAARVTNLPEGLKARDFRVLLPVQFSLENEP